MTIFDLLFIALFLASVVTLVAAAFRRSFAILRIWAICLALYMTVVFMVAAVTPQRIFHIGDKRCFDDWCITVTAAEQAAGHYLVTLRLSSEAKRVSQRELGLRVYLTDAQGRRFDPLPDPSAIPLDVRLEPGQAIDTKRAFAVPVGVKDLGLVAIHEGVFPRCCIIGDDANPLHKRTVVRLP